MRHPRLPFGMIWLPVPSLVIYLVLLLVAALVGIVPKERLYRRGGRGLRLEPAQLGGIIRRFAWVLLCSGSYTLAHVKVKSEHVAVCVRLI